MLNTLLNHWIKTYGNPNIVRTDPEGAFRDQGLRRGLAAKSTVLTLMLGTRPGKQECLGKHWIPSNSQQYVWLEELLTVSHFKKSLMNALLLTMTHIEIEDSLRGSCCWERHRQTSRFATWLSVDEAAKQRLRVTAESCKAYIEEELSLRKRRKEIQQARPWRHWAAGEWCWYWRSGKHKGSRMKGGVLLGPARVLLQERQTTAGGVRMKGVVWITKGSMSCTAPALSFRVREKIVQYRRHRSHQFQDLVRRLPHSTSLDLTTQTDALDDA